jgi:hypothetical protein
VTVTANEVALIDCCRGDVSGVTADNWRAILEMAAVHEVDPLVVHHLRGRRGNEAAPVSQLPEGTKEVVERQHTVDVIQYGLLIAELQTVLAAMGDTPALVLKGPSLALRYYAPGARLSRDIDLLIRPDDYDRARAALTTLGYAVMADYDEEIQRRYGKDVAFTRIDSSNKTWSVELHWRLTEPGAPELDILDVWRRARLVNVGDRQFQTTSPEHTLLLLALNLRKQRFARLKTVCDIAHLIAVDGAELDWSLLHEDAHRAGICALLRHSLRLTKLLMGVSGPDLAHCSRRRGVTTRLLRRLATLDAVLREGRQNDRSDAISGLIPFFSLDNLFTSLHLVYGRLVLSPELASYHRSGLTDTYRSRRQYWQDTARRLIRAVQAMSTQADDPTTAAPSASSPVQGRDERESRRGVA